jgi:ribosomal protein L11 methyltransferase
MPRAPYDQLYIYVIQGDARGLIPASGADYLGLWLEGDMSFVFFASPQDDAVNRVIRDNPHLELSDCHHMTYEQWQGGLDMQPMELPGLSVVPAWADYQAPTGRKVLRLDPGLVFGNGLHPTTRHCLELLCHRADEAPLGRVLDLGCGTGILGLAAALLGAEAVLAVDLNPLCVTTTQNNADLNQLRIEAVEGEAQDYIGRPANLVLANLHLEAQRLLWADPAKLEGKTDLIVSGITRSQVGGIKDILSHLGYGLRAEREAEHTWFTLWYGKDI